MDTDVVKFVVSLRLDVIVFVQVVPHTPPWHVSPDPHAVGLPQTPGDAQVLTVVELAHSVVPGVHCSHVAATHTGSALGHCPFALHPHEPPDKHAGVCPEHVWHVPPPTPQALAPCALGAMQVPVVPVLQHPPAHVFESQLHVPAVVSQSELGQLLHVAPPAPHRVGVCDP
jgi:hypothetical protein